jgi:hypothetical protein
LTTFRDVSFNERFYTALSWKRVFSAADDIVAESDPSWVRALRDQCVAECLELDLLHKGRVGMWFELDQVPQLTVEGALSLLTTLPRAFVAVVTGDEDCANEVWAFETFRDGSRFWCALRMSAVTWLPSRNQSREQNVNSATSEFVAGMFVLFDVAFGGDYGRLAESQTF